MLQVRENEISLRRRSGGGTAQLRTLERILVHMLHHQIAVRVTFKMTMGYKTVI